MTQIGNVIRIQPNFYIHVLNQNTIVQRVEIGPQTFIAQDHERVVLGPEKMLTVPPRHCVIIGNPIQRDENGSVLFDQFDQAVLSYGDRQVRVAQDPFPLYPGEVVEQDVTKLNMVYKNCALHLRCMQSFERENEVRRIGDEWLFEGPGAYIPNINVDVVGEVKAVIVKQNQAVKLMAMRDMVDGDGVEHVAGEEWIIDRVGALMPHVYVRVVEVLRAHVLTDKRALHIRALRTFTDQFGTNRKNGEEWLITHRETETYILSTNEEHVGVVNITTLDSRQYAVLLNPRDPETGTNRLGEKQLLLGEQSFFLQPGETLENGIQDVFVLTEEEGLVLTCHEEFVDVQGEQNIQRTPGSRWMIRGPMEYVPPVQANILNKVEAIPLDKNEGIYVRNIKTGIVKAIIGETCLLTEDEELWEKELPKDVGELLASEEGFILSKRYDNDRAYVASLERKHNSRDKSTVVRYQVRHNEAVQVYDFRRNVNRVVLGPALVLLQPDEIFTSLKLSGGKEKRGNQVRSLHLRLGPEFSSDTISVETSDHARLRVQLSYNWHFEVCNDEEDLKENNKLFAVEDFIGDLCKTVASRIRGSVSSIAFDDFHRNSARLIRGCVFGSDEDGHIRDYFHFLANNLVLTGIDIQSIEPEDPRTRAALQNSVQLAIQITTRSQEAVARQEADRMDQEAKGKLERQKLLDECEAEKARKTYVELQAEVRAVETTGQARAEAQSNAEAARISGESAVADARLRTEAERIQRTAQLQQLQRQQEAELEYLGQKNTLNTEHSRRLAEIEADKFQHMIEAIGPQTMKHIALAGPELQSKLLGALGLESTMMADNPVNLFRTTNE